MDGLPEIPGYTSIELIAGGGTADVVLCLQHSVGQMAAVKVLRGRQPSEDASLPPAEARRASAAGFHPHIVPVLDAGRAGDGRAFIVMPYFRRRSLHELGGGDPSSLTIEEILRVSSDVAAALMWAHASGLVHGDLKPHNVLVADDGRAMVADFGGAIEVDDSAGRWQYTAGWAAPEMTGSRLPPSVATDIYGLGAIMFYLLYGSIPHRAAGSQQLDRADVPARLSKLVDSLVDLRPHARPVNASTVAAELNALLSVPRNALHPVPADGSSASEPRSTSVWVSAGGAVFTAPYSAENRRAADTTSSRGTPIGTALPPPTAGLARPTTVISSDYRAALEMMTGIAAPLLSAAAVAFVSVILQAPTLFRLGDIALVLLVLATVSLIFSLQAGFHVRAMPESPGGAKFRWINAARQSYTLGILLLGSGMAVAIVPVKSSTARWTAFGVAVAFVFLECVWALVSTIRNRQPVPTTPVQPSSTDDDLDWI